MSFPAIQPGMQPVSQNIILPNAKDINYALEFDGTDDYVEVDNPDIDFGTGDFTVAFVVKTPTVTSDWEFVIRADGDNESFEWGLGKHLDGVAGFHSRNSDGDFKEAKADNSYPTDEYFLLAGKRENGDVYVWDSIKEDWVLGATGADMSHNVTAFRIGATDDDRELFEGIIDKGKIWDKALSKSEMQENINGNDNEDGLVTYYKMNEGSGSTIYDSASDNDGQIIGATWQEVD